ncbi:FxsA family protein [Nocardioides campestrisoli]|uniref:FxsA family protein n=1 Tax=Nocardioides campestrisoli TaxID=2736757 RepID=UPI00163D9F88|nr:FxsA family protein [Nocardioides campestrisoli]
MSTARRLPLWLPVLLLAAPLAELWVLIQVGQVIGAWWTIGLLILMSVLGSWLIRREGVRAWRSLSDRLASGRMPTRELADGALIVLGGALLLTPGFLSDVFGLLLILPVTRPIARRWLTSALERRVVAGTLGFGRPGEGARRPGPGFGPPPDARHPGSEPGGPVVRGEVVDP